jgi:tetratricopeptide (TPR) repeat protein
VGTAAVPIVLTFLLVFFAWRMVFSMNGDLVRARAWGVLVRKALPFIVLTLMALSMLVVRNFQEQGVLTAWAVIFVAGILLANLLSTPAAERRATKAFRRGDYESAIAEYRTLAEERPLARYHAFLGAALGANGESEESIEASNRALEEDPQYGLAYYNRALVHRRENRRSRAAKDLQRAIDADLPRRFKNAARKLLEETE